VNITSLRPRSILASVSLAAVLLTSCSSDNDAATTDSAVTETIVADTAGTDTTAVPETSAVDSVVRISVTVGVDSSPDRVEEVALGQQVALTLTNPDADDEFHLHGYDLGGGVTTKGESKTFTFSATEAGEFELESHVTGEVLVVVKVS
jgi:hypothetical protein